MIKFTILSPKKMKFTIQEPSGLAFEMARYTVIQNSLYVGEYEVTPKIDAQTMATKDKVMSENVTVKAIPYYEVSNPQGGTTIIIGGEN